MVVGSLASVVTDIDQGSMTSQSRGLITLPVLSSELMQAEKTWKRRRERGGAAGGGGGCSTASLSFHLTASHETLK